VLNAIAEHLLVATDFSTPSKRAASATAKLAQALMPAPTVTLFNAVAPLPLGRMSPFVPFGTGEEELEQSLRHHARDELRAMREACFGDMPVRILETKHPHPALAVCDTAEQLEADLVAIGTHGLTGVKRVLFGSVAARVLRHATMDVLAVPESFDPDRFPPQKILVATDFSRPANRAVATAARWAIAFRAPLIVLHAVALAPVRQAGFAWAFPADLAQYAETMTQQARERLQQVVDRRLADVPDVSIEAVLSTTEVERTIVDYAHDHDVTLVVIGSVGRTGMQRLLLGSAAEGVTRHSEVPVLCVRDGK